METAQTQDLIHIINNGGVVIYPTDTIRGVGCDATDEKAVEKVFALKDRPAEKSLVVIMPSFEMLETHGVVLTDTQKSFLADAVKPTTLILSDVQWLATNVYNAEGTVAIRIVTPREENPASVRCSSFLQELNKPLVSTSANKSGQPSPKNFADIDPVLLEGADGYLSPSVADAAGEASQIVRIDTNGEVAILRP